MARTARLPGMADEKIKAIEDAADTHKKNCQQLSKLRVKVGESGAALLEVMKSNNRQVYFDEENQVEIRRVRGKEKVRVKAIDTEEEEKGDDDE